MVAAAMERLAREEWQRILAAYPVLDGWRFVVNRRAMRRLGCCKYTPRVVEVSAWLLESGDAAEVLDTLRHEAAHALAGPGVHHGPVWRKWAVRLGAKPERLAPKHVNGYGPTPKWRGTCDCPGKVFRRHRLSRRMRVTGYCPKCGCGIRWLDTRTNRVSGGSIRRQVAR